MIHDIELTVMAAVTDTELNTLFAAAWPDHTPVRFGPILERSLTWVTARSGDRLVGFVNVATDGGVHAFLLDTTVHPERQRHGVGRRLVATAIEQSRSLGMAWMHVDYEPHLRVFYQGCGFQPTQAGLLRLT